MTEIPLAWVVTALTSIAAIAILRATRLPLPARVFLAGGLGVLASIGLLLGFRLVYGSLWAGVAQPMIAVLLGPAIYLGLAALAVEDPYPWRRILLSHGLPLACVLVGIIASNFWLADFLLPLVALVYVGLFLRLAWLPDEAFIHVTPRELRSVRAAVFAAVAFFLISVIGDLSIFLALLTAGPETIPRMVSGAATVMTAMVFVVALVGVPLILSRPETSDAVAAPGAEKPEASAEDREILARFNGMLEETRLYTDSALTLARAARRLGIPARTLSGAVNRVAGTNVSRHINGFRVEHAGRLLRETDLPVTEVMLEAGFLTKSTFNSEFRRVTGQTPSAYRAGIA